MNPSDDADLPSWPALIFRVTWPTLVAAIGSVAALIMMTHFGVTI